MSEKLPASMLWGITTVDAHQYFPRGDDLYLRFELRNEQDLTSMEVVLPWTGKLIDLMDALELEVRRRVALRLDISGERLE